MAIDAPNNSVMGGGKQRHSPLDRTKKQPEYTDKDRAAYEAYKKDFAADVATGRYGATDRAPLSMSQAYRIGFKSPAQSKAALASNSREYGRNNIDETTGRSAVRTMTSADAARVGLTDEHAADMARAGNAIKRKK